MLMIGRIQSLTLLSGQRYTRRIALNRYLNLDEVAIYHVDYELYFQDITHNSAPSYIYSKKGTMEINITKGEVDMQRIKSYIANTKSDNANQAEESVEMLLWSEASMVDDTLVNVVGKYPQFATDIMDALDEHVQNKILQMAITGDYNELKHLLSIYQNRSLVLPYYVIKAVLSSDDRMKIYCMLEYLHKFGTIEDVKLISPFIADDNDSIRKLASDCLTMIRSKDRNSTKYRK